MTQQQQPVVESGSRTDLPADADPVVKKNPSETVDPQHAIKSSRAAEPVPDQGRIVDAEISTNSGSTSYEDNDAASKPQEDVEPSPTTKVDPSPKNYYERQSQRKKEKIEARKKESKWLPHDNAEKKQGAQPTAESQPVPTAGVDLSSTDRSRPPTDDPQQTQENANGAAEQKKDAQPSPPAEQQPGPPAGVDLSSKNPPKTGGSQATDKNAQPSRPAGNQSGGLRGSQFAYEYVPHVRPTAEQPIPTVGVDLSSKETPKAQPGLGVSKFADPNRVPHVRPTAERPIPAVEADLSSPKTPG
jgi:hypothetical protein